MALNEVALQGRLTADPEKSTTRSGIAYARFTIAVDRDFSNQDGKREADFIRILCWRGTAEFISRYFAKGDSICVTGRIQTGNYTDRDGNKRSSFEVVASNCYFCGSKRSGQSQSTEPEDAAEVAMTQIDEDDPDLPF